MITSPVGFCSQWIFGLLPLFGKVYPSAPKIFEMSGLSKQPTRLTVYSLSPKSWFSGKWQDIWKVATIGRYTYFSLNHVDGEKGTCILRKIVTYCHRNLRGPQPQFNKVLKNRPSKSPKRKQRIVSLFHHFPEAENFCSRSTQSFSWNWKNIESIYNLQLGNLTWILCICLRWCFTFLRWVNHLQTQHLEDYVLLGIWYVFSDTAISNIKFQVSNEKNPAWLCRGLSYPII